MNDDADDDGAEWDDVCGEWESRRLIRPWDALGVSCSPAG